MWKSSICWQFSPNHSSSISAISLFFKNTQLSWETAEEENWHAAGNKQERGKEPCGKRNIMDTTLGVTWKPSIMWMAYLMKRGRSDKQAETASWGSRILKPLENSFKKQNKTNNNQPETPCPCRSPQKMTHIGKTDGLYVGRHQDGGLQFWKGSKLIFILSAF